MKVHGLSFTPKVQRILIAAQYAGVEIAVEEFFPKGQTEEVLAEFRKKNPNGLVPTLEAPEGCLYETNAILRYVARSNEGANIYGKTDFERALIDQHLDWIATTLEPALFPIFYTLIGLKTYEKAAYETGLEAAKKVLRIVDDRLKQSKFLAGDSLSIADIALVSILNLLFRFVFDEKFRKPFQNLSKYFETVANEENFKKILGRPVLAKVALPLGN